MNLQTRYLGLDLKNPIVVSASPLSRDLGTLRRLEEAGAGAIVMHSLFEEEVRLENQTLNLYLRLGVESYAEALTYFPAAGSYRTGADSYLELLEHACRVLTIPVIASLNGVSVGGWVDNARRMEAAGAHALELNMYQIITDPAQSASEVEDSYLELLEAVLAQVKIPVSVKLSPFFSALPHMVKRIEAVGASGVVLFNRFYQPDIDIEALEVIPNLILSDSHELRLPLRWIAILYGRVGLDLALTTGVHTAIDVVKALMAGATVAMLTSELLQNGIWRLRDLLGEVSLWLEDHEYDSLDVLRGSMSQINCAEPGAFERANYMKVLQSFVLESGEPTA